MTSFDPSKEDVCPKCLTPLTVRSLRPYPVYPQLLFGVSFIVFLMTYESIPKNSGGLWVWSGFQTALGAYLIYARLQARKRVSDCARCHATLP